MTDRRTIRDMKTALSFDGENDYVEIPDAGLPASTFQNGFTISGWINPKSLGESNGGIIFDKSSSAGGVNGFVYRLTGGGLNLTINNTSGGVDSGNVSLKEWSYVTVTVSSTGLVTHYIGKTVTGTPDTDTDLTNITTTNAARIGNRSGSTDRTFDGSIDELRIFNRALTAEEVKALYTYGIVPDGLVAEYLFDEGTGTTAIDTAGSNHGTISGATYTSEVPKKAKVAVPSVMPHVLRFDGGNDLVDTTYITNHSEHTLIARVRQNKNDGSYRRIIGHVSNGVQMVLQATTGKFYLQSNGAVVSNTPVDDGEMHTLIASIVGTYVELYVDGVLDKSGTLTELLDVLGVLRFGNSSTSIDGESEFFAYLSRGITAEEAYNLHHYNIIPENGLVGNWDRISDDGTKLLNSADPSGATDGTISGAERETNPMKLGKKPKKARVPYVGSVVGNGSSSQITITETPSLQIAGDSMAFFARVRFNTLLRYESLAGKPDASDDSGWYIDKLDTGKLKFSVKTTNGVANRTSTNQFFNDTDWHDVWVAYDGAFVHMYRDGQHIEQFAVTGDIVDADGKDLQLLVRAFGAVLSGNIVSVRLYNVAPTTEEIEQHYLTNTTKWDNNKDICVLNLEAKSGQFSIDTYGNDAIWLDQSGNGNNGAMIGCSASVDAPSKARKLVIDNLLYKYNGDFTTFPAFVAKQTVGGRVVSGNDGGALVGAEGYPTSEKQIFKWRCDMYQVTNGRAWYDIDSVYGPYKSGVGMVLEGKSVKERVNITQGQRNFGDLDNSEDIARNLIPVKPSTNYRATIRYKCFHLANEVGDSASYGLDVNMIGHTATRFTAHHRINEGIIPLVQSDDFVVATLEYTTDSDELFCNPFISIRGNSSNYADIGVAIDYIRLEEI
jgi:hypothetical protein